MAFRIAFLLCFFAPLAAAAQRLDGVRSFAYQLQDLDLAALRASPFDLLIVDYSFDGQDSTALTPAQVADVASGKPGRVVVSYFSIGEAEDYRFYFKRAWLKKKAKVPCKVAPSDRAPGWLERPNPDFCGNYKTRYWLRSWQRILFGVQSGVRKSYLDRIIDAGFHGVYLDIIDGYEYWRYGKPKTERRKRAGRDMALLVERIAKYARVTRGIPNFVVIPQNGSGILDELSDDLKARYLVAIDGLGAEDTFFFGEADENNPLNPQTPVLGYLEQFKAAGKPIFSIDYLTDPQLVSQFRDLACGAGFIPQVGLRDLARIDVQTLQGCS